MKLHLQSEDAQVSSLNLTTSSDIPISSAAFLAHHTKQVPSQAEVKRDHFPPQEKPSLRTELLIADELMGRAEATGVFLRILFARNL